MLHVLIFLLFCGCIEASASTATTAMVLSKVPIAMAKKTTSRLDIYEYAPMDKQPYRLFTTVRCLLNLSATGSDSHMPYDVYRNENVTDLALEWTDSNRLFGVFRRMNIWHTRTLPPFAHTYIGIDTQLPYAIKLGVTNVDYTRVILFVCGIVLYLNAHRLARNTLFYYGAGCSTGVLASIVILVFVVYRLLPKRSFAYSILVGGWSFSFYILYSIWTNLHHVIMTYQKHIAVYIVSVLLISFAVCYRMGPPKNERSLNLTQWALQFVALLFIYLGCQIEEISLLIGAALIIYTLTPREVQEMLLRYWYKWRPPARRFLTEAEYIREGAVETERSLKELRAYCASPDCNAWQVMNRLRSPRRFASFVAGGSHVRDDELMQYDEYSFAMENNDDDDDDVSIDYDDEHQLTNDDHLPLGDERVEQFNFAQWPHKGTPRHNGNIRSPQHQPVSSSNRRIVNLRGREGTPGSVHSVDTLNTRMLMSRQHGGARISSARKVNPMAMPALNERRYVNDANMTWAPSSSRVTNGAQVRRGRRSQPIVNEGDDDRISTDGE